MSSYYTIANSSESRLPSSSNGTNSANMGQDQSSQKSSFKSEMTISKCFHKIGSTDANLPLLREKNVWIRENLATQSQDEKASPATSNTPDQIMDEVKYDNELFYCEACCDGGFSDSWTVGFNTRSAIKDGQKVRGLFRSQKKC